MVFLLSAVQLLAQNRTVTGKVTDEKGAGVAGASVTIDKSNKGVVTSSDGSFTITVPANAKKITVRSASFETQTIDIPSGSSLSIKMVAAKVTDMGVVEVNTGIGKVAKKNFTGASSTVSEKDLSDKPVGSLDQLFQGQVPGLLSLTGSGQPGQSANIIIRGSASILGGSDPLYIVDGVPVEQGVFQGLNPNDFASVDILKDAAGSALYGSRGSAGVIVVTSKRGQVGNKAKMTYSVQMGVKNKPEFTYDMMNTKQLLKAQEDLGNILKPDINDPNNAGLKTSLTGWWYSKLNPAYALLTPAEQAANNAEFDSISNINTNWNDYFFRTGNFSNHELTFSGGSGKTRFYSNLGLYNEEGVTQRTDMKRISWRNNFDYSDDKFSAQISSSIAYTKRNFQQSSTSNSLGNPFLVTNLAVPYVKPYNADGSYAVGAGTSRISTRALELTSLDYNYNDQVKVLFSLDFSYKISRNLIAKITAGIDFRETQNTNYGDKRAYNRITADPATAPTTAAGFMSEGLTRYFQPDVRPSLNWKKTFNDKHEFDVSLVGEYLKEANKTFGFTGYGVDPKRPNTPAALLQGNADNRLFANVSGGKSENTLLSGLLMGRYTYNDKYTITGSYRKDGASKLPESNRWQSFYSLGLNWDVTKEKFMSNVKKINSLRLRFSYGSAGNFNNFPFSDYYYIPTYSTGQYVGIPTTGPVSPGNPDLKWERIFTSNLGLDFSAFNNRFYGDINFYDRKTKDLFVFKTLSSTVAAPYGSAIYSNAGILQNKGFEWNLNYELIKTKNLTLTLYTKGGYNKNQVLSLGGVDPFEQGTELIKEGIAIGSHYEVKWGGVDAATGAPLYYDLSGKLTNVYSAANKVQQFGTWEAPWKGGWGTRIRYKAFDFNILFSFQKGAYKSNNLEYFVENPVGFMLNGYNQAATLNFWKQPGDIASTPSPLYGTNFSSKIIHDASFIRLKEVSVYYTLPQKTLDKIKFIRSLKFFVMGNNLYLWTKWVGMDPEAGATNINLSEFPNPKAATVGLEVGF